MYIIIYIRPSLVLLLKTVHSLDVHISCHYLSYINIVISVHCTWDFGPPNLLYNIVQSACFAHWTSVH